ncbi:hypothetical protein K491DRAFT_691964 [Lophiostoma macrostomum CBS 122681]|uniref:Uncharacterized protein n=1 Tax=Lophiostoma macrostomum CBS 122681 TaxID=1314788 RepID=A0A6A6T8U7_9PLEO|nr:hypothetical protein K491DRAFT_691964 [Lophiostoma macrostomum CBS 122681]
MRPVTSLYIGPNNVEVTANGHTVVHLILTPDAGMTQIPALGSRNYENAPVAGILGAGYDDETTEQMRDAAKGMKEVLWLRPDTSKPAPPVGPEYGKALVKRIKETVEAVRERGDLGKGGVIWY